MKDKLNDGDFEEVLTRGVEEIIDRANLEKKLKSGKKLRIKLGIDPTSPNIHLGRSIPLLKLRDFQKLGHQIVLVIGDFTGLIGDTSDKESERPMLSAEVIKKNLKNYTAQAAKIIDLKKTEVVYNSKALKKLGYLEIGTQADAFSLNEFISRENISKRLKAGKRVSLRELLYPLMQGYDSVVIKADVEIGGTDQRFNLLAGRDLQRLYKQEVQDVITNPLIEGLDGRKMSSSFGNTVNLFDEANEMFGKIMSLNDEFIIKYFTLLTRLDLAIVKSYEDELKAAANPRDFKIKLAREIVKMYHCEEAANLAEEYFIKTFSQKEIPSDIMRIKPDDYSLLAILVTNNWVSSNSEAKRVIEQGGVRVNNQVVKDTKYIVATGSVIQKGKMYFLEIE